MKHPLQILTLGYSTQSTSAALSPGTGKQIHLYQAKVHNRSGGAIDLGLFKRLATAAWKFFTVVAADTPDATDATTAIQAGSSTALSTLVDNSGFLIQAKQRFNLIGLVVGTAESGGSPVYALSYYNGSTYATVASVASIAFSSGTKAIVFFPPVDWVVGTTAAVGGDSDKYSIQCIATTAASSTAPAATSLWVGQCLDFTEGVADNGSLSTLMPAGTPLMLEGNEGIQPYFGTANAINVVNLIYQVQD